MARADGWFICRVGFLEAARAVGLAAGATTVRSLRSEWPAFAAVEVDQPLIEHAIELALDHDLRSLDALHLAAALALPRESLTMAVWDHRLHTAAREEGLDVIPETTP